MTRVLVTGASGFVGRALVDELAAAGVPVRAAMRRPADVFARNVEVVAVSDLTRPVEWRALLKDIDSVVHLAGIAHADSDVAEETFDRVNRLATAELAAATGKLGIRRLVFVSSVRAQSGPASADILREDAEPKPSDAYGRSKLAAEMAVRGSGAPYAILRPTLVYGPGARGNVARLVRLARLPIPLPLRNLTNLRSLLARENLVSAIRFALEHEVCAGKTYLVADETPISVADTVAALRRGRGIPQMLFPCPPRLIETALRFAGRGRLWERLGGPLVADTSRLRADGWSPRFDTREGLERLGRG